MICPICKTRWAPMIGDRYIGSEEERAKVFGSNKITSCDSPECLETVDVYIAMDDFDFMERWVAEVKEMIAKGEI